MSSLLGLQDLCGGWAVVGRCNLQQQFTKMFNSFIPGLFGSAASSFTQLTEPGTVLGSRNFVNQSLLLLSRIHGVEEKTDLQPTHSGSWEEP